MSDSNKDLPKGATNSLLLPPVVIAYQNSDIRKTQSSGSLWAWFSNQSGKSADVQPAAVTQSEILSDGSKKKSFSFRDLNAMSPTNW